MIHSIQVGEYPVKPINTRGRYFKRIAGANHQLSLSEITDLYMQSLQLSWDAYEAPRESLDALSIPKIERFIDQVNQCGRFTLDNSPLLALEKLKYIGVISRSRSLTTGSHSSVRANSTGGSP